jgi:UrcA family protein
MPTLFRKASFSRTRTVMPLALLGVVALTCLQGAAFAASVPMEATSRTAQVPLSGLNLASPADVAQLDVRIRTAARTVCAPADSRDLRAISDRPACEATAIKRATAKRDVLVARAQAEQLAARSQQAPTTN